MNNPTENESILILICPPRRLCSWITFSRSPREVKVWKISDWNKLDSHRINIRNLGVLQTIAENFSGTFSFKIRLEEAERLETLVHSWCLQQNYYLPLYRFRIKCFLCTRFASLLNCSKIVDFTAQESDGNVSESFWPLYLLSVWAPPAGLTKLNSKNWSLRRLKSVKNFQFCFICWSGTFILYWCVEGSECCCWWC